MAEEEKIQEHAKKAVRALTDKKKKWKERIIDFLYEIFIIIVAVSITLWFHNWSDRRADRETEKNFLIELRKNLKMNTDRMDNMIRIFPDSMIHYYDTILAQVKENKIDTKYIDANSYHLLSFWTSNFDFGLFESFQSVGNLKLIENEKLRVEIINLYSAELPYRQELIRENTDNILQYYDKYVGHKCGAYDRNLHFTLSPYVKDADVLYFLQTIGTRLYWLVNNMHTTSLNMHYVLKEIDTELKDRFGYEVSDKN